MEPNCVLGHVLTPFNHLQMMKGFRKPNQSSQIPVHPYPLGILTQEDQSVGRGHSSHHDQSPGTNLGKSKNHELDIGWRDRFSSRREYFEEWDHGKTQW